VDPFIALFEMITLVESSVTRRRRPPRVRPLPFGVTHGVKGASPKSRGFHFQGEETGTPDLAMAWGRTALPAWRKYCKLASERCAEVNERFDAHPPLNGSCAASR